MGEREYKVVYKSRNLDRDEERPRIPTALNPYDNHYSSESPRRHDRSARNSARNSTTKFDDGDGTAELARSTTRTSYTVREDDRSRSAYVDSKLPSRINVEPTPSESISVRGSVVGEQQRDDSPPRRSEAPSRRSEAPPRSYVSRDRGYAELEVGRSKGRGRDYRVEERRDYDAPYVIDARDGDIIDISYASTGDRGYSRSHIPDRDYDRTSLSRPVEESRSSTIVVGDREYPRSRQDDYRSSRAPPRDYEREEDWKLVDSMRDTRIASTTAPTREPPTSRSRAPTLASEDSYVMVSPTQAPRTTRERSRARSAIARSDYPDHELRRRRSRSISFRDSEINQHEVGQRRHERPGAEADICGPYLRSSDRGLDDRSEISSAFHGSDYRPREPGSDAYAATYHLPQRERERDGPYPPQQGYSSRRKETEVDYAASKAAESERGTERRDRSRRGDTEIDYASTKISDDRGSERRDRSRRRPDTEADYSSRRRDTEVDYAASKASEVDRGSERRDRSRRRGDTEVEYAASRATEADRGSERRDRSRRRGDTEVDYATTKVSEPTRVSRRRDVDSDYVSRRSETEVDYDDPPSRRDRSRRRRRDDDEDDTSYYSENVTRKSVSRYR